MTILYTMVKIYFDPIKTLGCAVLSTYFSTAYQPHIGIIYQKNTIYSVIVLARHKMLDTLYLLITRLFKQTANKVFSNIHFLSDRKNFAAKIAEYARQTKRVSNERN